MKNERILYLDLLKTIAIFAVISIHLFNISKGQVLHTDIGNFQAFFRFAVPIFLMVTGVLFLNKEIDLKIYFKKRFTRIFYPLIFFTIITELIFQIGRVFNYYWYSWMILGVIFAIPIINKFILYADEKELNYYLLVIIAFSIIQQIFHIFEIRYALDMTFFLNPVAYLLLGYYLYNKDFNCSTPNVLAISLVLFIVSSLLKFEFGNYYYSTQLLTFMDLSLFQLIQAASLFVFVKYLYDEHASGIVRSFLDSNPVKKFILSVSKTSYGMYFIQHPIVFEIIKPYYLQLSLTGTKSFILIIAFCVAVFFISWILTLIFGKIPYLNKVSGYHP